MDPELIVTVCLGPACLWVSLPWSARRYSWWLDEDGGIRRRERCPRCGGRTFVTRDAVLMGLEQESERRSHT